MTGTRQKAGRPAQLAPRPASSEHTARRPLHLDLLPAFSRSQWRERCFGFSGVTVITPQREGPFGDAADAQKENNALVVHLCAFPTLPTH